MFCNRREVDQGEYKFLVKFVSFSFTAFVNKVLFFLVLLLFSLFSPFSLLSFTFPAAKHTS